MEEFTQRRNRLAVALHESNIDAFILEPGYSFQYYANISQTDWEPWEPEERPFLMVVQPDVDAESGQVLGARTSFLAPHFEEDRVRMLGMPFRSTTREEGRSADAAVAGVIPKGLDMDLDIIVWEEDENPYQVLRNTTFRNISDIKVKMKMKVTVMVDEEIRDFIVRGLTAAGFDTVGLNHRVESVKQRKTSAEIELLRAVNTGTVEAVRQMRPCECFKALFYMFVHVIDILSLPLRSSPRPDGRSSHNDIEQCFTFSWVLAVLQYCSLR